MKSHRIFSLSHVVVEALLAYGTLTTAQLWYLCRALDFTLPSHSMTGKISRMVQDGYLEPIKGSSPRRFRLTAEVRTRHALLLHVIDKAQARFDAEDETKEAA